MVSFDRRVLNGVSIKNSDTTGSTKFQDLTLTAGVETDVGEFDVPTEPNLVGATWGSGPMFAALFDDTTTAVREEGVFKFYVQNTRGMREKVFEARSEVVGASGQVSTPSEHNVMPLGPLNKLAPAGGKLVVTFTSDATDITDSTDHTITELPVTLVYR